VKPASGASPTLSRERRRRSGKGGCPIRSLSVWLTACSAALALAGCGGQEEQAEPEVEGPRIERAIANALADLSDEVANRLESGDSCGAAESAALLRERLTASINEGKVPEAYLEELSGATNELELAVPKCIDKAPPPPPDTGEDEDDDDRGKKGKRKKKKKKDKKDDGDDTTTESLPADTITIPEETTTEETTTEETPTVPTTEDGR
jgi:hypothetical protein